MGLSSRQDDTGRSAGAESVRRGPGLTRVAATLLLSQGVGRLPGGRRLLLSRSERRARAQFTRWGIGMD
jgi:hypothetical protein